MGNSRARPRHVWKEKTVHAQTTLLIQLPAEQWDCHHIDTPLLKQLWKYRYHTHGRARQSISMTVTQTQMIILIRM